MNERTMFSENPYVYKFEIMLIHKTKAFPSWGIMTDEMGREIISDKVNDKINSVKDPYMNRIKGYLSGGRGMKFCTEHGKEQINKLLLDAEKALQAVDPELILEAKFLKILSSMTIIRKL